MAGRGADGDPELNSYVEREGVFVRLSKESRAHANAVENLVIFAPAATACALYFFSRLVHYVTYTAGIPGLRTLAFFGGWGVILVLRLPGVA